MQALAPSGSTTLSVQQRASQVTTSVLYDRGGIGWSDAARLNRSAAAATDEARALFSLAEVQPPYVLVGHSLGGLFARRYAQRFPSEVVGLVLLDPAHEDYEAFMPARLHELRRRTNGWIARMLSGPSGLALGAAVRIVPGLVERIPIVRRYRELYRHLFTAEMAEWPAPLRDELVELHVSMKWLWAGVEEARNAERLYREARTSGPLPNVPTIILCAMGIDEFRRAVSVGESESLMAEELSGKRRLYEALAATLTRGEVRPVDAGHVTIHFRQPEAVVRAIADVLGR